VDGKFSIIIIKCNKYILFFKLFVGDLQGMDENDGSDQVGGIFSDRSRRSRNDGIFYRNFGSSQSDNRTKQLRKKALKRKYVVPLKIQERQDLHNYTLHTLIMKGITSLLKMGKNP
jgi:hypothetical protein